MDERKWITLKDKNSFVQNAIDLLDFLKISNFDNIDKYIGRKVLYKKKEDADITKVYLWIKRCDDLANNQTVSEYTKEKFNDLLDVLKQERMKKFNKEKLIKIFNEHGIYLVIEDALKGTKTRGCTSVKVKNPAIYLTTYLKEKSLFYFTLYHELSHVKTVYNKAKNIILVNDGENNEESKRDEFALNQMIDNKIYRTILNNRDDEKRICKENNIPLSFLYSRMAYEGLIKYNSKEYLNSREII